MGEGLKGVQSRILLHRPGASGLTCQMHEAGDVFQITEYAEPVPRFGVAAMAGAVSSKAAAIRN